MSGALEERLASILPADGVGWWTRPTDGARFPLAAPDELDQFPEVMRLARADGLVVQPVGLGSKQGWCRPAPELDLVLSTRRFTGIVEYEAADGTITARAGTPMAELAAVVAAGGHHLAPAVPRPERSSLGGVLAAGQSGYDRLRFGAARDQVLGSRVLLADGRITGSGGRLVKNVTGYDLPRAWCGSHGTLCVILEACLRLYKLPPVWAVGMAHAANRGDALDLAATLRALPVQFVTLLAHDLDDSRPGEPWTLLFVLAGEERPVAWETELVTRVAPDVQVACTEDSVAIAASVRDLELSTDGWPTCALTCRPSDLEANLVALQQHAGESGLAPRLLTHPGLARTLVWLDADDPAEVPPAPARLREFHGRLAALPARLQWFDLPPELADDVDPFGAPTAGLALMRRLEDTLDPEGRFARGRFHADL